MIKTALRRGAVAFGAAAIAVTSLAGVVQADVGVPYVKPDQRGGAVVRVQEAVQLAGYWIVRAPCTTSRP